MPYIDQITRGGTTYGIQDSATKAMAEAIPPMIAYEELTTTATHAYTAGNSYFILGGVLYKATADIAIGDPIATTGTGANCQAVPGGIGGEVSELQSVINQIASVPENVLFVTDELNNTHYGLTYSESGGNSLSLYGTSSETGYISVFNGKNEYANSGTKVFEKNVQQGTYTFFYELNKTFPRSDDVLLCYTESNVTNRVQLNNGDTVTVPAGGACIFVRFRGSVLTGTQDSPLLITVHLCKGSVSDPTPTAIDRIARADVEAVEATMSRISYTPVNALSVTDELNNTHYGLTYSKSGENTLSIYGTTTEAGSISVFNGKNEYSNSGAKVFEKNIPAGTYTIFFSLSETMPRSDDFAICYTESNVTSRVQLSNGEVITVPDGGGCIFIRFRGNVAMGTQETPLIVTVNLYEGEVANGDPTAVDSLARAGVAANAAEIAAMQTTDVKWCAMGDSITSQYYSYFDDQDVGHSATDPTKVWAYLVSQMNYWNLTNIAVGGTGFLYPGNNAQDDHNTGYYKARNTDFTPYNLVTVAYGINDWKANLPIGTINDDATAEMPTTVMQAAKATIEAILASNPHCKIIAITPLNCAGYEKNYGSKATNWALSKEFSNSGTLETFVQNLIAVFNYYDIQYIDMTHYSAVNRENIPIVLPDGVHPSLDMHKLLAHELSKKITF